MSQLRAEPARLDPVFARLHERIAAGALPSAALAIGDSEGLIRADAFSSTGRPISTDSNYYLASLTKPIVGTLFMQLVEEGRADLHQPIADLEPRMRGGGRELVTPWHVLTHTSGVTDIDPRVVVRQRPSPAQMTTMVIESPLRFEPGTRWEYNSASFYLLTLIVERLTGTSYVRALDERLQEPLGMHATFDPRRSKRTTVAVKGVGIDNFISRFLIVRYMARAALPGGGLFGNLDDLVRFGAAVLQPRVVDGRPQPLTAATVAAMGEDQTRGIIGFTDGEEKPVHHGLGWGKPTLMRDAPGSQSVISHGGASGTRLWIDPDAGLVLVFLTNQWAGDRGIEAEALNGTYAALRD